MDDVQRLFYKSKFLIDVVKLTGSSYQALFERIMIGKFGSDFQTVRTWGREGDWKCDGYLQSTKTVFQVYAPNSISQGETLRKIEKDYRGAHSQWGSNMTSWTFVHNGVHGLPAGVISKISDMRGQNPTIKFEIWGPDEVLKELLSSNESSILDVYGPMPTRGDLNSISYVEIKNIVDKVSIAGPSDFSELNPVSSEKLYANNLSSDVQQLIKTGLTKANVVASYFYYHPKGEHREHIFAD